jgi:hypothetical protein
MTLGHGPQTSRCGGSMGGNQIGASTERVPQQAPRGDSFRRVLAQRRLERPAIHAIDTDASGHAGLAGPARRHALRCACHVRDRSPTRPRLP